MSWPEVDCILTGYQTRQQKALAGHRLTALQAYNLMAEKPVSEAEYLYLPAVDGPRLPLVSPVSSTAGHAAFMERIAARLAESAPESALVLTP